MRTYDPVFDDAMFEHMENHVEPQKYRVEYRDAPNRKWQGLQLGSGPFNQMYYLVLDYRDKYPPEKCKYQFRLVVNDEA